MKLVILILCISLVLGFPNKKESSLRNQFGPRIIGGSRARSGQFPFAAAIYTTTTDGYYFCGGTLLNEQWILTAGQCVDGVELFDVRLGATDVNGDGPYGVKASADQYVLHPDYDPFTLDNDLGLIRLHLPVQFSDYLKPVDFLPFADLPSQSSGMAIGWGQLSDENSGLSKELQWVDVTSLANLECSLTYGAQIKESMVCVAGNFNEGTCLGDTGSPLIQLISNGRTVVAGISSFFSYNGCENTDPSGFARVYPYNDWIRNATGRA